MFFCSAWWNTAIFLDWCTDTRKPTADPKNDTIPRGTSSLAASFRHVESWESILLNFGVPCKFSETNYCISCGFAWKCPMDYHHMFGLIGNLGVYPNPSYLKLWLSLSLYVCVYIIYYYMILYVSITSALASPCVLIKPPFLDKPKYLLVLYTIISSVYSCFVS